MKRLCRPILTLILISIMTLSTAVMSFASDHGDPIGKCIAPRYETNTMIENDIN